MPLPHKSRASKTSGRNQTLHDFFSATPLPKQTRAPHAKAKQSRPGKAYNIDHNVIIIDSDSDVEFVETPVIKKPKLSSQRIDTSSTSRTKEALQSVQCARKSQSNKDLKKGTLPQRPEQFDASEEPKFQTFGSPYLLIQSKSEEWAKGNPLPYFGTPHLLSAPPRESDTSCSVSKIATTSNIDHKHVDTVAENSVDLDLTLDEWKDGDDEDPVEFVTTLVNGVENFANKPDAGDMNVDDGFDDGNLDYKDTYNDTENNSSMTNSAEVFPNATTSTSLAVRSNKTEPHNLASCDIKPSKEMTENAFSVLMTAFKENEVWKEATIAERSATKQPNSKVSRRKAPFYKVLQGMPIAVDAFKYGAIPGVTAYFLTHAHSDHYTNLSSSWKHGHVYCSQGTANLIIHMLSVDPKWVRALPMDEPTLIPNTGGVTVTLIEANHCPGSCLFFFEGRQTVNAGDSTYKSSSVGSHKVFRYLHCGDFRASPRHILHPAVKDKLIDHVYLDTTYLDPKYTFPPQPLVISACAELAKRLIGDQSISNKGPTMFSYMTSSGSKGKEKERGRPLIVVGTYSIGKERIVKAVAHALNSKVYCDARKMAILKCQGDSDLDAILTNNPRDAMVHLVPLGTITAEHLKFYLDRFKGIYDSIIGFRPTGWTYVPASGSNQLLPVASILAKSSSIRDFRHTDLKVANKSTPTLQIYPVPYSEHSSFYELTCFAMSFSWVKMIATVNVGSESSRGKMKYWMDKWEAERRRRGKDTIIPYRHPDYW